MRIAAGMIGWLLAGIIGASAADGPASRAVLKPTLRLEALKLAARVLEPREPDWKVTVADLPDPFFRTNFAPTKGEEVIVEAPPRDTRSEIDVLRMAAANLHPTGIMMVEGENYMLMEGKRYRSGAVLPMTIDGIVYQIAITAIEGKSYTLRLNEQELRQQLK